MGAISRSTLLSTIALCLFLTLAGFLTWAVLAGGYQAGIVIPVAVVIGVVVAGTRLARAQRVGRPSANVVPAGDANRTTWALAMLVLGVLAGWLCGELVGFLLLPILWLVVVPRVRRRGLLSITLPPFGLGLVLLPLYFLAVDLSGGSSWLIVFWFAPEVVVGVLLMLSVLGAACMPAPVPYRAAVGVADVA